MLFFINCNYELYKLINQVVQQMLSEGDTFEVLQRPINKIQLIIQDPLLSEFKYHFIIKKLPILHVINDNFRWNQLLMNLYKGFNAYFMGHNSINIVQVLNHYPQTSQVDLIVGLRRDQQALKFYRQIHIFQHAGKKYEIQVAEAFKAYLDQLNQKYRKQAAEHQRIKAEQIQNQKNLENKENENKDSQKTIKGTFNAIIHNFSLINQGVNSPVPEQKVAQKIRIMDKRQDQGQKNVSVKGSSSKKKKSSQSSRSYSYSSYQRSKDKKVSLRDRSRSNSSYGGKDKKYAQYKSTEYEKNKYSRQNRSSSRSERSRSRKSSSSSDKKHKKSRVNSRNQRSRQKRYYKHSSSRSNSSSRRAARKSRHYSRPSPQKRSYGYRDQRKHEQNRKYQITPTYNRSYSGNYSQRYRESAIQLPKKYSHEPYNSYKGVPGRYESSPYQDHNKTSVAPNYNYYKNSQNYSYAKPNPPQFQHRNSMSGNLSTSKVPDSNANRYLPKNNYYQKSQGYNQ